MDMAADRSSDSFAHWFADLRCGLLDDFLRHEQFPPWIELASRDLIQREFTALARKVAHAADQARRLYQHSQVEALARRLLLSRDTDLIGSLKPLWQAFGTSDELGQKAVKSVAHAIADWPREPIPNVDLGGIAFSPAHADFVESMRDIALQDRDVLGDAIRNSRIVNEARHVGFPVVVTKDAQPNINAGIWIEPFALRPGTETRLKGPLAAVWQSVLEAFPKGAASGKCPSLPKWFRSFRRFASETGSQKGTLDSAGLSLSMQLLADQQQRLLPFGIGFSGKWEAGRLCGVTGFALKQQAAADAGVFLLFACKDQSEPMPGPIPGVRLVLLDEHLSLEEVIRQVNRVCAESGITEYRWRRESGLIAIGSRDLPNANDAGACPVGFVGRHEALEQLHQWRRDSRKCNHRRIHAVIGAGQTGKTTLLSQWANDLALFPVWSSFRRGDPRSELNPMLKAIAAQIDARFAVLHLPQREPAGGTSDGGARRDVVLIENAISATDAAVDVTIDGIDEAATGEEQARILRYLQRLPGKGLLLIGSQPLDALRGIDHIEFKLCNANRSGEQDALELIDRWADQFARDGVREIAADLREEQWRRKLVQGSGGNLAVLHDVLSKAARDWPKSPDDLILAKEFKRYGELLLEHVRRAHGIDPIIEEFIAFRAFLDRRRWPVTDVLKLMGRELDAESLLAVCGRGATPIRQFIEIADGRCRFQSSLLHDFAREHYSAWGQRVAYSLIESLADQRPDDWIRSFSEAGAKPSDQVGPTDLPSFAVRVLPGMITKLADATLADDLVRSTWLHRRLSLMGADTFCDIFHRWSFFLRGPSSDLAERAFDRFFGKGAGRALASSGTADGTGLNEKLPGEQPGQGNLPNNLAEVMNELIVLGSLTPNSDRLRHVIDFLACWGPRLACSRPVGETLLKLISDTSCSFWTFDAWWDAVPALRSFPKCLTGTPEIAQPQLLTPWPNGYSAASPANPQFLGVACELHSEDQPLLLATQGGFMVFRKNSGGYSNGQLVRLPEGERIGGLAAVSETKFAVIIHELDKEDVLRVIDLATFGGRTLVTADLGERFESLQVTSRRQPLLLSLISKNYSSPKRHYLRAYSMDGEPLVEDGLEVSSSRTGKVEVVAFAPDTWAIIELDRESSGRLIFQRLVECDGSRRIETFGKCLDGVRGACAIPDGRLAATRGNDHDVYLEVFDSAGTRMLQNRLYSTPDEAREQFDLHHDIAGGFLLSCRPVAWHKTLGVLLAGDGSEDEGKLWHVLPRHEEMPRPVPKRLHDAIGHEAFSLKWRQYLSLKDETVLIIMPTGAVRAGPEPDNVVGLEGGLKAPDTFKQILGVRADGSVIVREQVRWDKHKVVHAEEPRIESPPGNGKVDDVVPEGADVVLRNAKFKREQVADFRCDREGGCIVAAVDGGLLRVHRFDNVGRFLGACGPLETDGEPQIRAASRGLVFIDSAPYGRAYCIDFVRRRYCRIGDVDELRFTKRLLSAANLQSPRNLDAVRIIDLPTGHSLVLLASWQYGLRRAVHAFKDVACHKTAVKSAADELQRGERLKELHRARYFAVRAVLNAYQRRANAPPVFDAGRASWHNRFPARVFIHVPGSKPILSQVRGATLSKDTILYRVCPEQDGGFLLSTASILDSYDSGEKESQLRLQRLTLRLDRDGGPRRVGPSESTTIDSDLACWHHSEQHSPEHIMLAFESGRIEIRRLSQPEQPVAIGYVLGRPDSMIVSSRGDQRFLAVAASEMTWFDISHLVAGTNSSDLNAER
jgi:hypothetical protein